jgi:AcrR family transcriptional regulator
MSMEAVATAARVSKATIYRRWPSKDALIVDLIAGAWEDRDSGVADDPGGAVPDARAELREWVREALLAQRSPQGVALQHLVRRAAEDPALAASLDRRVLARQVELFEVIVRRGVDAGQLRPDLDVQTLLDLVRGPVLYRRLIAPAPPVQDPDGLADAILDMLWPGIRAGAPDDAGSPSGLQ